MFRSFRTLAVACLSFVMASAVHADQAMPTTNSDCFNLACFGKLAVKAKLATGELQLPLQVYHQADCQQLAGLVPASGCKVIEHPHFEPMATAYTTGDGKRTYSDWHSLKNWGAMLIGEQFYDRGSINAVALATRAECDQINFALETDETVPCFHMDNLPLHDDGEGHVVHSTR